MEDDGRKQQGEANEQESVWVRRKVLGRGSNPQALSNWQWKFLSFPTLLYRLSGTHSPPPHRAPLFLVCNCRTDKRAFAMFFNSIVPTPKGTLLPQQILELTTIFLESTSKSSDSDIVLILCHHAEAILSQIKRSTKKSATTAADSED